MTLTTRKTHATTENGIVTLYDTNGQGLMISPPGWIRANGTMTRLRPFA